MIPAKTLLCISMLLTGCGQNVAYCGSYAREEIRVIDECERTQGCVLTVNDLKWRAYLKSDRVRLLQCGEDRP